MKKKTSSEKGTRKRAPLKTKGPKPADEMECLCLECGISNHLVLEGMSLEDAEPAEPKILANIFCTACGGPLLVRGRAGEEPFYPAQ